MSLVLDYLEKSASILKNKIAVICEEDKITYGDLINDSMIVGSNLID